MNDLEKKFEYTNNKYKEASHILNWVENTESRNNFEYWRKEVDKLQKQIEKQDKKNIKNKFWL